MFVCSGSLRLFEKASGVIDVSRLKRLPHYIGNESRHVFFDVSDNFTKAIYLPIMFIRCDVRSWMLPNDPGTIQMAWPVEDYSECVELPMGGFKYDVSFQGWITSHGSRQRSVDSFIRGPLKCDIAAYTDFTGYIFNEPEGIRRRAEFRRSMRESRICLCPESISGVLPYRFFEAMSAGRVPLLVGSEFVMPFEDEIDYSKFMIACTRDRANQASMIAEEFLQIHSDEQIVAMGLLARKAWEQWLDARKWPQLHAYAVKKKLGMLQPA